ncbi:hypothetical protein EW145_g1277 [Phellinidium pouzarii]|uniref:Protein SQS1 n=1 Tax=Phellinidium pouzarii TaxID=167371 RepID=A0A4S4LFD3_9AGAM|nr:hypothetical protein EW145_g1277 [Phellinidium pouzarii]
MKFNPNMPLSKLLALDRPYLKPIHFVPAQLTPVLFKDEEELLVVEDHIEPEDHVPTADRVSRVFSHQQPPKQSFFYSPDDDLLEATDSEPVMTVDFNSLGKLMEDTSVTTPAILNPAQASASTNGEGASMFNAIKDALADGKNQVEAQHTEAEQSAEMPEVLTREQQPEEEMPVASATLSQDTTIKTAQPNAVQSNNWSTAQPRFVVDPNPTSSLTLREEVAYIPTSSITQPLGSKLPDDEVIVYDAPNPRSRRATPSIPSVASTPEAAAAPSVQTTVASSSTVSDTDHPFNGISFSFGAMSVAAEANCQKTVTPRSRRLTKKDRRSAHGKRKGSFGTFGAMLEEKQLHEDELIGSRRVGSDIDWGDSDDKADKASRSHKDGSDVERGSSQGGMDADPDIDIEAMQSFVGSMSIDGMVHTRIDDIEDAERVHLEAYADSSESSDEDSELEAAINAEEELVIGGPDDALDSNVSGDSDEDIDISTDEEDTPKRSFTARLEKMRENARGKGKESTRLPGLLTDPRLQFRSSKLHGKGKMKAAASRDSDDSDFDDSDAEFTWADQDDDYLELMQDLLDENEDIISGHDRKAKKALFQAVHNGDFSVMPAKKKRDRGKDLPADLRAQWENDRAKKAENKRKRAAARLEAAADPFALHRGGKKGRKDMLRASRLAAEAEAVNATPTVDIIALVSQIRAFSEDQRLTQPMALSPMDKATRAMVHEIADALNLKSQSKGRGASRYITLAKKSRSRMWVNEHKIEKIMQSNGNWGFTRPGNPGYGGKGKKSSAPKQRDGDEVGKAAPKIGEGNIGFQMLANMGWSEGGRIGISGGLDAPLTAIIKNSKLGLGATY